MPLIYSERTRRGGERAGHRAGILANRERTENHTRARARANPKKIYLCGVKIQQTMSNETNNPPTIRETVLRLLECTDPDTGKTYRESVCAAAVANASKPTTAGTRERNLLYKLLGADQARQMFERYASGNSQDLNDCNPGGTDARQDAETLKNTEK